MRTCRFCSEEFTPLPGKPGRIDVCYDPECQKKDRRQMPEPLKRVAKIAWSGKHTPEIEIVEPNRRAIADAAAFNAAQKRFGHTSCLRFSSSVSFADMEQ